MGANSMIDMERGAREYALMVDGQFLRELIEKNGTTVERIVELVEADRSGRCVVPPVKPGADVYVIRNILTENEIKKFVAKMEVREFIVNNLGNCYYVSYSNDHWVDHFNLCEFGKTVFLTREEAEAAMKGEQHGN